MMGTELVGWAASAVLLATLVTQIVRQWRTRATQGLSPWLFIGQIAASVGFVAYSLLQGDAVFAVTNSLILVSAAAGQYLYWRNRRRSQRA
jgi:uncharacterized protein with PQ loop repeat